MSGYKRCAAFIVFMYLSFMAVSHIGDFQPASGPFTLWDAFWVVLFIASLIGLGFDAGREHEAEQRDGKKANR